MLVEVNKVMVKLDKIVLDKIEIDDKYLHIKNFQLMQIKFVFVFL